MHILGRREESWVLMQSDGGLPQKGNLDICSVVENDWDTPVDDPLRDLWKGSLKNLYD